MSWRVTLACTRAEGEAVGAMDDPFEGRDQAPVIVADEPDEHRPDDWLIHAYFEERPDDAALAILSRLASGAPRIEALDEEDWVTLSQEGLEPLAVGPFHVRTRAHPPREGATDLLIPAGLAFGTGQHATTRGCLEALVALQKRGRRFERIADIGTGTGLLAFAALSLWPGAEALATDIDPIAIEVTRENAALNGVRLGSQAGALALLVADGMEHEGIAARAPFDLLIANILAGPLIALAPSIARSVAPGGAILLAGLLDTQAEAVAEAYAAAGCALVDAGRGEWPVLLLERRAAR